MIPVAEVERGMTGYWHTVVSGTEIEVFELRVLGIAHNYIGPRRSVIIAEVVDEQQRRIGPVAGMSGSPVFTENGRLMGAYAYGFLWPKDQAIVGITPIEDMFEIWDDFPMEPPPRQRPASESERIVAGTASLGGTRQDWRLEEDDDRLPRDRMSSLFGTRPMPVGALGFSQRTLDAFRSDLSRHGLDLMSAPLGGSATGSAEDFPIEPGSALAAVLMHGDFTIAATGTVTWVADDLVLGFGHPFLQVGQIALPMAGAEILTIVQSVPRSFKLAQTGPIIGTIFQDRLTAVGGRVGEMPPLTQFRVTTESDAGRDRSFSGEVFEHPQLTPLFSSMALLESLSRTMEFSEEQTLYLEGRVEVEGLEPIRFADVGTGPGADRNLAMGFYQSFRRLMENPFALPRVEALEFHVRMVDRDESSVLREVRVDNRSIRSGDTIDVVLTLLRHQDEPLTKRVRVPIPGDLRPGEEVTLMVADARRIARLDGRTEMPVASLEDIVERWRDRPSHSNLYLRLLRPSKGLHVEGSNLRGLPPSVLAQLQSPGHHYVRRALDEEILWKKEIHAPGRFEGMYRLSITIE